MRCGRWRWPAGSRARRAGLTGAKAKALVDSEKSSQLYRDVAARAGADARRPARSWASRTSSWAICWAIRTSRTWAAPRSAGNAYDQALAAFRQLGRRAPGRLASPPLRRRDARADGHDARAGRAMADAAAAYEESYEVRRALGRARSRRIATSCATWEWRSRSWATCCRAADGAGGAVAELSPGARRVRAAGARAIPATPTPRARWQSAARSSGGAVRESGGHAEALDPARKPRSRRIATFASMDAGNVRATCDLARVAEALGDRVAGRGTGRPCVPAVAREPAGAQRAQGPLQPPADAAGLAAKLRSCGS